MTTAEQQFNRLAEQAGITNPDVLNIVNLFFHSGIAYALKEQPERLCALVQSKDAADYLSSMVVRAFHGIESGMKLEENLQNQFKQSDLQYLSHVLRVLLNKFEEENNVLSRAIKQAWEGCDPDRPETKDVFKYHNRLKDALRDLKGHSKRLASIQNTVKKEMKKG